jgi:hypothetical protein
MLTAASSGSVGAPIPAGKELEFIANGRCATLLTTFASDVRAEVTEILSDRGWVVTSSVVIPKSNERLGNWDYRAEIRAKSPVDHARVQDMEAVVVNAFWQACGTPPTVNTEGYTRQGTPADNPSFFPMPWEDRDKDGKPDGLAGLGTFILIALVLITATGVFVAKRG